MKPTILLYVVASVAFATWMFGCCEPLPCQMPTTTPQTELVPPAEETTPAQQGEIPVVALKEPGSASVSFRFSFTAGSAQENAGKQGLALVTAWLIAEGGGAGLSAAQLKERLFPMAADIGISVDKDQTVFYGRVLANDAPAFYELLRDALLQPNLGSDDFERIRGQVTDALISGLRGSDDEELGKAALDLLMYQNHPYATPVLGTRSGLAALSVEDVRDFRERHLCRHRVTIGLAGDLSDELVATVRADMEKLPVERCEGLSSLPQPAAPTGRKVLLMDKPEANATAISIGFPLSVRRGDPDYAALKLVEAYFGQHRTFSGRLQKQLRVERGLNYGNYAYAEHFEQEGHERIPSVNVSRRQQDFTIWLRPVKDSDRHFALRLALAELARLIEQGLTPEQLGATRTFMKGYYPSFVQTQQRRLGYAIDERFYSASGDATGRSLETLLAAIDNLTVAQVNDAIRKHLRASDLYIAMVTKEAKTFAQALASDTASPISYSSAKPAEIVSEDAVIAKLPLGIDLSSISILPSAAVFE